MEERKVKGTSYVTNKFAVFKENLNPDATTHQRTTVDFGDNVGLIRVIADAPCFYKLGDSSVAATATDSVKLLAGGEIMPINGLKRISVIAETGTVKVNISEYQ